MKLVFINTFTVFFILVSSGCGGGNDQGVPPTNHDTPSVTDPNILSPTILNDINSDPKIVEVNLIAGETVFKYGTGLTKVFAYNNIIPGPTIEANVGDKIIVNFTNNLKEPTTVHWHGVELPANMDGTPLSQNPVAANGGTFRYEFTVHRAATYWYHPHIRSNVQVEMGLYGALIVRESDVDTALGLPTGKQEHVLILDDVKLNLLNQVTSEFSNNVKQRAVEMLNGREGDTLLVNGKVNPRVKLKRGVPVRMRVINASNSRFMRLSIANHELTRIGGDAGLISEPRVKAEIKTLLNPQFPANSPTEFISDQNPDLGILLTPGERAEFVFTPDSTSNEITLNLHDIYRGRHIVSIKPLPPAKAVIQPKAAGHTGTVLVDHDAQDGFLPSVPLATFELTGTNTNLPYVLPTQLRAVSKISLPANSTPVVKLVFGHTVPDQLTGDITFFVKVMPNPVIGPTEPATIGVPFDQLTSAMADTVKPNETRIIEIINTTGGDHNFHLHGFMFQLLDTQYIDDALTTQAAAIKTPFVEFKDTIIIPRRLGTMGATRSITRLLVKFDDTNRVGQITATGKTPRKDSVTGNTRSGGWAMHCHILEHADRGMMSFIQVVP